MPIDVKIQSIYVNISFVFDLIDYFYAKEGCLNCKTTYWRPHDCATKSPLFIFMLNVCLVLHESNN